MELEQLLACWSGSPAVSLLRSPNAAFLCDFLNRTFKQPARVSIPHSELIAELRAYQDELADSYPAALPSSAESYLAVWCREESRWLQRLLEGSRDEPMYRLTPHTEDVLQFLERILQRDLAVVGTASRMKLVVSTLSDLVAGAAEDPRTRLRYLRAEKHRIESEMTELEQAGPVSRYQPAQIRERFQTAVAMLKRLKGDFRAVEESFREIASQVQQQQVAGEKSRGGILEYALDAEDVLKQQDQGVSFHEFVELILSPDELERLERLTDEVRALPELADQHEGVHAVRDMIGALQQEAEAVMRTNQRLTAILRRMLNAPAYAERQRVAQLLREIRNLASSLAATPPRGTVGLDLETELAIDSPLRRSFWTPPARFETMELVDFEADAQQRAAAFDRLAAMERLDWRGMRHTIHAVIERRADATLGELLDEHPPRAGIIEVLGYLQIARDDGYAVNVEARESVFVPPVHADEPWLQVILPLVRFTADSAER